MPDEADYAEERAAYLIEVGLRANTSRVSRFDDGKPGECDLCGEPSLRLVDGNCCRCRDKYKLG